MALTVYELIQELSKYNADDEVEFHVKAEYSADVEANFDRDNEEDTQEVTVDIEFDDDVEYEEIREKYWKDHTLVIDLKY